MKIQITVYFTWRSWTRSDFWSFCLLFLAIVVATPCFIRRLTLLNHTTCNASKYSSLLFFSQYYLAPTTPPCCWPSSSWKFIKRSAAGYLFASKRPIHFLSRKKTSPWPPTSPPTLKCSVHFCVKSDCFVCLLHAPFFFPVQFYFCPVFFFLHLPYHYGKLMPASLSIKIESLIPNRRTLYTHFQRSQYALLPAEKYSYTET